MARLGVRGHGSGKASQLDAWDLTYMIVEPT